LRSRLLRNMCNHRAVQTSHVKFLVAAAVAFALFSVVVVVVSRRRGDQDSLTFPVIGVPGVYLGLCATVQKVAWLYVPSMLLMVTAAAFNIRSLLRKRDTHGNPDQ
jgi:hypothetical protein